MRKIRLACAVLAAGLTLTACAGSHLSDRDQKESETAPERETVFQGEVVLSGEGRADSAVSARVKTEVRGKLEYRWFLDGRELLTRGDHLQIPYSAEGGSLVCRVTCEGMAGEVQSEPLAVLPRGENAALTMAGLREDVKWINRTTTVGSGMTADWSASGFEMDLRSAGGPFRVYYDAAGPAYFAVFVDGEQVARPKLDGEDSFAVDLSPGNHRIRICRETEIQITGAGVVLKSVVFDGLVLTRPADRDLLIHVIGDSISCGDGALGTYRAGETWVLADHSGTNGFGYLVSEMLSADYDLVGKGGIGLIKPSGAYNVTELYDYVNRYRGAEKYDFDAARAPDVILLEQGANDSADVATEEAYYETLLRFIRTLRQKWGEKPLILWVGKSEAHYRSALRAKAALSSDPRLEALQTPYGGSGSAALATQKEGHPSAAEQREMAEWIVLFLREKGVV